MFAFLSRPLMPVAAALAVIAGSAFVGTAQAESVRKQCSEKYQAAKTANTLNGQTWNQFYKQCSADLKATAEPTTTEPATTPPPKATPTAAKPVAPAEPTTAAPTPAGPIVFPTAVSPKYSSESAGKARMHTCLDQYKANKDTNSNGGMKWIEKGGGYYSECNKKLKGA
jgi:hypothetical protein